MSLEEATLGSAVACVGVCDSGSSGMVSRDIGRAALDVLLLVSPLGDLVVAAAVGRDVLDVGVRLLVGLDAFVRDEDRVEGRFAGAAAVVPPSVVRLVLSELGSGRAVLELVPPRVVVLDEGRLFSSPVAVVDSSPLPAGLRAEDVVGGRVGGLLIVLPEVRDDMVLWRAVEGDAGVRDVVLVREEVAEGFLASSAFAGAFAPGVVLLSMFAVSQLFTPQLLVSRRQWAVISWTNSTIFCVIICVSNDAYFTCSNGVDGGYVGVC